MLGPACAQDARSCGLEVSRPSQFEEGETCSDGGIDWLFVVKIAARMVGRFCSLSLTLGDHEMILALA